MARLLLDVQWLAYFEREPQQASIFMQQRLKALLNHAMQNSAWWRERLKGVPGRSATFADVPLLDRAAFRASIEHAGGTAAPRRRMALRSRSPPRAPPACRSSSICRISSYE